MKKLLLGLAFVALTVPAKAADLPVKALPAPAAYNWSGCYIGGNAGAKWGRFDGSVDTAGGSILIPGVGLVPFAPGHVDLDPINASSVAAGGQLGCRWENRDHWVFGIEGDFDWTDLHGTSTVNGLNPPFPCTTGICNGDTFTLRSHWESSARIILGHSFDRWLVYATGGWAFTQASMDANFVPTIVGGITFPGASGSDSKVLNGGTVGLGAAYALGQNWEVGAEYRYTYYQAAGFNLGNVTAFCAAPIVGGGAPVCASTSATGHAALQTNEILFRLNYRFDWARPVVASD
jgi:outer membrane immunogenic protein